MAPEASRQRDDRENERRLNNRPDESEQEEEPRGRRVGLHGVLVFFAFGRPRHDREDHVKDGDRIEGRDRENRVQD